MVVEDDDGSLRMVRRMLKLDGYAVESAQSGSEAMDRMIAIGPALVLMDIHLRDKSGIDVLAWMKMQTSLARTPVIAMTASVMPNEKRLVFAAGFDNVIFKPVLRADLTRAISAVLGAQRG
jgi:two-component system cell cycle response regulator DivK